ncbi:DUF397 domain-containing protein [Actinomadura scrupuli]|uniref:DUF397 domain-containing protein n=1 Tax=Actinomadura scrupuli TaxID=559629 RepID=UPI003D959DC3
MTTADLPSAHWRKSSRSGDSITSDCVEVADLDTMVGIRDSKAPHGPALAMTRTEFTTLAHRVKTGELDL